MGGDATSGDGATAQAAADDAAASPARDPATDDAGGAEPESGFDLKGIVRQLTAPMIESLDTRLRDQIEAHVDELLQEKIEAAVADRLSTVDRAIADLSRSLEELDRRLGSHERHGDEDLD